MAGKLEDLDRKIKDRKMRGFCSSFHGHSFEKSNAGRGKH
jgi:hypothetical protein